MQVPRPTALSTLTSPPWARTIPCATASPSPRPAPLVVKNGSKMRPSAAASTPQPVSRTSSSTPRAASASDGTGLAEAQDDLPAFARQRLAGVRDQVHQHLAELRRVAVDADGLRRREPVELRAHRQRAAQRVERVVDDLAQVDPLARDPLAPREGEHLAHQRRGALAGAADLLEALAQAGIRARALQRQLGVPEDADQEVVEVVGDPAREQPEALEML